MRLSDYVAAPRDEAAVSPRVLAVVTPALAALGAGEDPEGWLAWGDDPGIRWQFLAPTAAGLVTCSVRVNVAGEGPRAGAKVTRWPRVQVGELAIESAAGGPAGRVVPGRGPRVAGQRRGGEGDHRVRDLGVPGDRPDRPDRVTAAPALRRRPVRPRRRARGQRAMVERRPDRVRARARPELDRRRPPRRDGRELAGLGADHAGAARARRHGSRRDPGRDRRRRGRALPVRAAAGDRRRRRRAPADRGGGCRWRSPRRRTRTSSPRPSTRSACETSWARSSRRTRSPHGKPAPDVYLVAAEQLGVAPARCLVVEDSVNGVKAGKAAGHVRRAGAQRERPAAARHRRARGPGGGPARRPRPGRAWRADTAGTTAPRLPPWPRPSPPAPSTGRSASVSRGWLRPSSSAASRASASRAATASRPARRSTCPTTSTGPIRWSCWRSCRPGRRSRCSGRRRRTCAAAVATG